LCFETLRRLTHGYSLIRKGRDNFSAEEQTQREYYNRIADEYDSHYAHPHALRYRHSLYDIFLDEMDLEGKTVLDAACGGGEATVYLKARGAEVTGLDISERCCELYAQRFPDGKVVCASMLRTGLPDASFDLVLTDSLHHLHPYVREAMTEMNRILKPDGYFLCWEPNAGSVLDLARKIWYRLDRKFFESNEESIEIKKLMTSSGDAFEIVSNRYGGNVAYLFVNLSMALRIPTGLVTFYAPFFMWLERKLGIIRWRFVSAWVLCLMRKNPRQPNSS
jgi:ubiquinone/menaquinone biosynthesis C-methylase UbiE